MPIVDFHVIVSGFLAFYYKKSVIVFVRFIT